MKEDINIIICGDICPTNDTIDLFEREDEISLFNSVLKTFSVADIVLGNLEFVLTDKPKPIRKSGPVLYGPTKFSNVLKNAGFDVLSLANNHIKDCGSDGVLSSIDACNKSGLDTFGAGSNLNMAKKPYIKNINGFKIGFIAFAEQEFNIATENEAGANYLDPFEDLDTITELKDKVDYLIVIYHGGIEYYQYPSPNLQKKCRKFIDKGADFVTCQHSHCIGTTEDYKNKKIIYGQGNTLFGYQKGNNSWNEGLIIKITINTENKNDKVTFLPIQSSEKGIDYMNDEQSKIIQFKLKERSSYINDNFFINETWNNFCDKKKELYFPFLLGFNRYLIHLNRLTRNLIIRILYSKNRMNTSHNILRCEAHNEVIQTLLNNNLKN
jgi:poly-gamma-glutamate capsule biosynthesis protein CapA/YwtB (metallophosphatase superfamily)